jgi:TonB dependent receptor/CarboxypepD_reg-like domain/TonB-dependent Receptor Plug Domain
MEKKVSIVVLLLLFFGMSSAYAQRRYTISGHVKSRSTGESIIGASVKISNGGEGTLTNEYGFFSLQLNAGTYLLEVSALGKAIDTLTIVLDQNRKLDLTLADATKQMAAVVVRANGRGRTVSGSQMGVERLSMAEVSKIPVLLGERDILKTIQLLPGIKSAGDGNSGFFVRGGAADQNMVLLDEAPVYNAAHLFGFFSTFNADAVKDVTVYKAGMPAQYGGRLSSVLDIKMNEGNNQRYQVSGGVGLIAAKANIEGPIQKGKSSFLISARRTYADLFLKAASDTNIRNNKLFFYDLNLKMNYQLGQKDRLYISGYFGQDVLGVRKEFSLNWGNATGTLRWNHIFNGRLFVNTSVIFSNYKYKINIKDATGNLQVFSQILDWNVKQDYQWTTGNRNTLRFGWNVIYHTIRPGEVTSKSGSFNNLLLQKRYSLENALYLSDTWKATERLTVTAGLRLTTFTILGKGDFYTLKANGEVKDTLRYKRGEVVKTYVNPEPRLALGYQFNKATSLKFSYVRNVQYLHLLSNSTTTSPTDKWIASTNIIKPGIADQVSLGWYKNLQGNNYELTVEAYYKTFQNQIDYRDGADLFSNNAIESQLLFGKGRAYGVEWLLRKKTGKLTGWVGYTLSKSERLINGLNNNRWYNARQDRTHDVAIVAMYEPGKRWSFSASWVYYTGDAVSFPEGKYQINGQTVFYYTKRNDYRMPAYHRLDLGATLQLRAKKNRSAELAFSLYNAYGRANAFTINFRNAKDDPTRTEAVQTTLFRFIPSVSYNFKF